MRKTITIVIIILTVNVYSQTYSSIIPDSTILNFMNWEIENSGLSDWPSKKRHKKKIFYKVYDWSESEFIRLDSATLSQRSITDYFNEYIFDENLESFIGPILTEEDISFITDQYKSINKKSEWNFENENITIRRTNNRLCNRVT